MKCGDTYLLYDEEFGGTPHLHLVISDPDEAGRCILVSITTRRAKSDTMVCLDPGDHDFISHPSVITYAYSKILTVAELEKMVTDGDAMRKEPANKRLITRAQNGMLETDRAPREVQELFIAIHRSR